jgi:hypothetical protein
VILELAVGAALVTAGSAVARVLWSRRGRARRVAPPPQPAPAKKRGAGLYPGDVLMLAGAEHALDRATELDDGGLLRVLETIGAQPRYVVQLDALGEHLVLAEPYAELPEGRVADVVPLGVRALQLVRRGEALAQPVLDDHEPLVRGRCRFTVLADRGGKHLVVLEPEAGPRLCLVGDVLDRRLLDVLPGG